jgi:peptidoglycan/xylan/chitin deacetylase (PgdA/CDA1 family)
MTLQQPHPHPQMSRDPAANTTQAAPRSVHFLYHQLSPSPSDYSYVVTTAQFARHLQLFQRLRAPGAALWPAITFDDGHLSDFEHALPLLAAHNLQAQFFITAGWTANRPGYMDWAQLRQLHAAGQPIGAHGWSHALLTHCNDAGLRRELHDARRILEDHLGAPVTAMSFPGGRFNGKVLNACRDAGYTQLYTSIPRADDPTAELIGRLNVRGSMTTAWLESLFTDGERSLTRLGRSYRAKAAAKAVLGDSIYARLWALLNRKGPDSDPADMM